MDATLTAVSARPTATNLVRAPEAAGYLGLATATLAKLRCTGGGPNFTKLGRVVIYSIDDLREWVASKGKQHSTVGTRAGVRRGED